MITIRKLILAMLRGKYFRSGLIVAVLLLGGLLGVALGSAVRAAQVHNPGQDNIVISEFRTQGPNGLADEFVELFNPTGNSINIGDWRVHSVSSTGGMTTRYIVPTGAQLLAGQHYLVATSGSGLTRDGTMSAGIADNGGVALTYSDGTTIIDKVGMSAAASEGNPLGQLAGLLDQSYERQPGGTLGNCFDSNDNSFDFALISPSDPQTMISPFTVCDPATDTPAPPLWTDTPPPTSTVTPTGTTTSLYTPTPTGTPPPAPTAFPPPTITSTSTDTPTPTNTDTPTSTNTGTPTYTPSATFTPTPSPALTSTPVAPPHLVISELRSRGPNGSSDEFVELYNPTGAAVNLSGWAIRRSSCIGTSTSTMVTITSNTILQPGQHYLVAATGSSVTGADQTYAASLADDGGVALVNLSGTPVDQVGMCISTLYREGTNLAPLAGTDDQSYERKPGGVTACYDTENNAADFDLISPANPQNKASPAVMCFGVLTSTPTPTPTSTATRTRTPTRTATSFPTPYPGVMAINEFLPHPRTDWNGDGKVDTGDEYIELINMGTNPVNLKNWKLDNGADGPSPAYTIPDMTLLPRQIALFFHSASGISLSDGGSTVRLVKPDGRTADIYTYPVVVAADRTWCRLPDGDGAFGFSCRPTPGRPNARLGSGTPEPGSTPPAESACLLGDTVPAAILQAECEALGSGIWYQREGEEFWLRGLWKWDVFIE